MPSQVALIDGLIILVGLLLIGLVAWLVSLRTRRTLKALTVATRSLSQGDFQVEVPIRSRGPAGELARAFNEMAHQLSASRQQITNYQKTLETRVRERTRELHSPPCAPYRSRRPIRSPSLPNRLLFRKLEESVKALRPTKAGSRCCSSISISSRTSTTVSAMTPATRCCAAATRLQDAVRQDDVVARFGGDEFVVLISRLEAQHAEHVALTVAERHSGTLEQAL